MPSWNLLTGNLQKVAEIFTTLPPAVHSCYLMRALSKDFPNGAFYFDIWPMTEPLLVVTDPAMANQVTSHPIVGAMNPKYVEGFVRLHFRG